jgi:hypothetical protein
VEYPKPWDMERQLLLQLDCPLNLQHNAHHPFHPVLTRLREEARAAARQVAS